jgi:hypothetical protein
VQHRGNGHERPDEDELERFPLVDPTGHRGTVTIVRYQL